MRFFTDKSKFTHEGFLCGIPIYVRLPAEQPYFEGRDALLQILVHLWLPVVVWIFFGIEWFMGWDYGSKWEIRVTRKL